MIGRQCNRCRGFTLIELMAVVLVVLVLAGIAFSVTGYVQRRMGIATTKAQIAAIEAALESYKSDWGYYPPTSPQRISIDFSMELTNNAKLYRALFTQGKRYLTFPAEQMRLDVMSTHKNNTNIYIYDVYGSPFHYYRSPTTPFSLGSNIYGAYTNPCTFGAQVNTATYDLFSYGFDRLTYIGTNAFFPNWANQNLWTLYGNWLDPKKAEDDITNWNP